MKTYKIEDALVYATFTTLDFKKANMKTIKEAGIAITHRGKPLRDNLEVNITNYFIEILEPLGLGLFLIHRLSK